MNDQRYLDELEDFLAEAVEGHRMYASDRVWRNISKTIQPGYKWPALTFGAVLLGALYMLTIIFVQPAKDLWSPEVKFQQAPHTQAATISADVATVPVPGFNNNQVAVIAPKPEIMVPLVAGTVVAEDEAAETEMFASAYNPQELVIKVNRPLTNASDILPTVAIPDFSSLMKNIHIQPGFAQTKTVTAKKFIGEESNASQIHIESEGSTSNPLLAAVTVSRNSEDEIVVPHANLSPNLMPAANAAIPSLNLNTANSEFSVTRQIPRKSPWAIRFYATPSVSYRAYFDNKGTTEDLNSSQLRGPIAPNWINSVNLFVRQKPMIGFEVGSAVSYDVSRNFKVRVGLQANYRQFSAEAFRGQSELALILMEKDGKVDSLYTMSSILNQNGKAATTITNRFVEIALPIGFDVELASGRVGSLFVSGSLQPTYTLHTKGYLLSTDYNRYVDRQDLFRNFAMNTSLEAYLQIPGNGVQWQIGPQIRYQATPGTVSGYGVRQHLVDYGMKIGVMKTLR